MEWPEGPAKDPGEGLQAGQDLPAWSGGGGRGSRGAPLQGAPGTLALPAWQVGGTSWGQHGIAWRGA